MPVTAPADRRFLRAQVKPGRRHSPWRARIRALRVIVVAGAAAWLGWLGVTLLAGSATLRVTQVVVTGNQRLSRGEVVALVDGLRGQGILSIRLDDWRARVLECPWVGDATLRRELPSTIEIEVTERHPIAIGRIGEELYLVDERGTIIDEFGPRYADLDLPVLDGLGSGRGRDDREDERRAALAGRLLGALKEKPGLGKRVSQVDVSDPRNAVVIVDQDTARVRLGEDRFIERLQQYLELAPALREQVPDIDYVDLRYGERVYVGSHARAAATVARGGGFTPGR